MMQTYSQNDLVRFLYHETSTSEDHGIAFQLEDDGAYNKSFKDMLEAKRILNSFKVKPSQTRIDRILQASRNRDLPALI